MGFFPGKFFFKCPVIDFKHMSVFICLLNGLLLKQPIFWILRSHHFSGSWEERYKQFPPSFFSIAYMKMMFSLPQQSFQFWEKCQFLNLHIY